MIKMMILWSLISGCLFFVYWDETSLAEVNHKKKVKTNNKTSPRIIDSRACFYSEVFQ